MIKPAYGGAERLPMPPRESWSAEQRAAAETMLAGPRKGIVGPFKPLLHSPILTQRVQHVGEYLRFGTGIDPRLTELAILIVAAHWGQTVEWNIHHPIALAAGVRAEDAAAISKGEEPTGLDYDQRALYRLVRELLTTHAVGDASYAEALKRFGERGLIDLVALAGYYCQLAMVMNVARTPD
jgi:4-carboxymuconolactone decarboxylase